MALRQGLLARDAAPGGVKVSWTRTCATTSTQFRTRRWMRSLSRRIADGRLLHVIKRWLTAPVVEVIDARSVQTAEARRTKRGTPQGKVISPLLANCYFRRFLLAWLRPWPSG